jgi:hypothetical protein
VRATELLLKLRDAPLRRRRSAPLCGMYSVAKTASRG